MFDKLVNSIDTSGLAKKQILILRYTRLREIPNITDLSTTTALNTIKNEIPNVKLSSQENKL